MTTARCPACGASVADGAPWCTLCYADLRAPAQPSTPPEPAQAVQPAAPAPTLPAAAAPAPAASVGVLDTALDAPVSTARHAAARGPVTWPCLTCGAAVYLDLDSCPHCGSRFLAGAEPAVEVDLPLLGRVRPLAVSKDSRVWLMVGGGFVLALVLTAVLSLVGLFL